MVDMCTYPPDEENVMSDWMDDPEAKAWAQRILDEVVPMIDESAVTISLVPKGPTDIKFATELGLSIMFDKPIIAVVQPGTKVPAKMVLVADEIVEMSGGWQGRMAGAIERVSGRRVT